MPPKKYSNITLPPRRQTRTTARKSINPTALISTAIPTTTIQISPPLPLPTTPPNPQTTPPKSSPLSPKTNHILSQPNPTYTDEEACPKKNVPLTPNDAAESKTTNSINVELEQVKTLNSSETGNIANGVDQTINETGAKTRAKKKTIRIVKRIVKKRVPKKKVEQQQQLGEAPEILGSSSSMNAGTSTSGRVLDDVRVESCGFDDDDDNNYNNSVVVGSPGFVDTVNVEVDKLKHVGFRSMEDVIDGDDNSVVMEAENFKSSVVGSDGGDDCEDNGMCVVGSLGVESTNLELKVMEIEKCRSVDVEKQKGCEVLEVEGSRLDDLIAEEDEGSDKKKDDGSLIENLSEVLGLEFDEDNETVSVSENQLNDQNVHSLSDQNKKCSDENSRDLQSGDGKREEEMKENLENNDIAGSREEALLGDGLVSVKMEALERRRRRKTVLFIGGLDRETKEEDVRKVFEEVGEVLDVRLFCKASSWKYGFVRYALATDAQKALAKYQKVKICGRKCSVSPVAGNDTLFLGNISKRWKSDDVIKLLRSIGIGKIDHVTVIADPNKTDLNRGFAFVELQTSLDAKSAYQKLQRKGVFGNLSITVSWAQPLSEPDEKEMVKVKSVYAECLPYSWDEEKVRVCFCKFGEIENVALAKDNPSSLRKDFAFVTYTTREAALACVEAFKCEQSDALSSKAKVRVSLAKPFPKGQQMKHSRAPPRKELSNQKHKETQSIIKLHEVRNMKKATVSNYQDIRADQQSSTTCELVQLLREQASSRPTLTSFGIGSVNLEYTYPSLERKRPISLTGGDSLFSDPRGHPRARVESSYPSLISQPHHHRGVAAYTSESFYRVGDYPSYVQPRGGAPSYHGSTGIYRRYG